MGQHLDGLPQAHVVGQHPRQPVLAQELQPVQTVALIGAQLPAKAPRDRDLLHPAEVAQPATQLARLLAARPGQRTLAERLVQLVQTRRAERRERERAFLAEWTVAKQLGQRPDDRANPLRR